MLSLDLHPEDRPSAQLLLPDASVERLRPICEPQHDLRLRVARSVRVETKGSDRETKRQRFLVKSQLDDDSVLRRRRVGRRGGDARLSARPHLRQQPDAASVPEPDPRRPRDFVRTRKLLCLLRLRILVSATGVDYGENGLDQLDARLQGLSRDLRGYDNNKRGFPDQSVEHCEEQRRQLKQHSEKTRPQRKQRRKVHDYLRLHVTMGSKPGSVEEIRKAIFEFTARIMHWSAF